MESPLSSGAMSLLTSSDHAKMPVPPPQTSPAPRNGSVHHEEDLVTSVGGTLKATGKQSPTVEMSSAGLEQKASVKSSSSSSSNGGHKRGPPSMGRGAVSHDEISPSPVKKAAPSLSPSMSPETHLQNLGNPIIGNFLNNHSSPSRFPTSLRSALSMLASATESTVPSMGPSNNNHQHLLIKTTHTNNTGHSTASRLSPNVLCSSATLSSSSNSFTCPSCSETFSTRDALAMHMMDSVRNEDPRNHSNSSGTVASQAPHPTFHATNKLLAAATAATTGFVRQSKSKGGDHGSRRVSASSSGGLLPGGPLLSPTVHQAHLTSMHMMAESMVFPTANVLPHSEPFSMSPQPSPQRCLLCREETVDAASLALHFLTQHFGLAQSGATAPNLLSPELTLEASSRLLTPYLLAGVMAGNSSAPPYSPSTLGAIESHLSAEDLIQANPQQSCGSSLDSGEGRQQQQQPSCLLWSDTSVRRTFSESDEVESSRRALQDLRKAVDGADDATSGKQLSPASDSPEDAASNVTVPTEGGGGVSDIPLSALMPYFCEHCDIAFKDRTLFCLHRGLHNVNDPWQCNMCGKRCASRLDFHAHCIHF